MTAAGEGGEGDEELFIGSPATCFGEGWGPTWPQGSGKRCERQVYAATAGFPRQIHGSVDSCIVMLQHRTEPASVRAVPRPFRGCAPTGPFRPPIGAHMNDP